MSNQTGAGATSQGKLPEKSMSDMKLVPQFTSAANGSTAGPSAEDLSRDPTRLHSEGPCLLNGTQDVGV